MIADTRQGVRFVTALGSTSCDSRHETGGTICYGHWVPHLKIADTRRGLRFVTGTGVLHLVIADTRQGVRFVTGIRFCIL